MAAAVIRPDGVQLYGLDAEAWLEMQAKRDPELEQELAQWIGAVIGQKLPTDDLVGAVRSGAVLCSLMNAVYPNTIAHVNVRSGAAAALAERENIQFYLSACRKIGLTQSTFGISDLYERKGELEVVRNLLAFARLAHALPGWKGPIMAGLSRPSKAVQPAKRWDPVPANTRPVYRADQPADETALKLAKEREEALQAQLSTLRAELVELKSALSASQQKVPAADDNNGAAAKARLESALAASKDREAALDSQVRTLNGEITKLRSVIHSLELDKTKPGQSEELKVAMEREKLLTNQVASLSAQLAQLNAQPGPNNNAEAAATAALRYELEVRKKQIENLSEELARMAMMEQEARARTTVTSLMNYRSLLSDRMRRLLRDAAVTDEEIAQLAAMCATELGLYSFSRTLKRAVKKSPSMVLCDRNFQQLLVLCHAVLGPAERDGGSTDLMSVQVIMQCACAIVRRRAEGGFEYLRDRIKGCAVWRSDRYWVDVFWQEVLHSVSDAPDAQASAQLLMPSIAAGLAYNMLFLWEVPDSVAESFAAQVRAATDGAAPNIVAQVRDYITARVDASGAKLKALHAAMVQVVDRQFQEMAKIEGAKSAARPQHGHQHSFVPREPNSLTVKCSACRKSIFSHTQVSLICTVCAVPIHLDCRQLLPATSTIERVQSPGGGGWFQWWGQSDDGAAATSNTAPGARDAADVVISAPTNFRHIMGGHAALANWNAAAAKSSPQLMPKK